MLLTLRVFVLALCCFVVQGKWNFNITWPILDYVYGTTWNPGADSAQMKTKPTTKAK